MRAMTADGFGRPKSEASTRSASETRAREAVSESGAHGFSLRTHETRCRLPPSPNGIHRVHGSTWYRYPVLSSTSSI